MEIRKINSEEGKEKEVQIWPVRVRGAKKAAASSECVPGGGTLGMAGGQWQDSMLEAFQASLLHPAASCLEARARGVSRGRNWGGLES